MSGSNQPAGAPGSWLLLAASLLTTTSQGAMTPVLPRLVTGPLGESTGTVGLVVAATSACALVAGLLAGPAADRRGPRRATVAGMAVAAFGLGAMLLVPDHLAPVVLVRALTGIGTGIAAVALMAWAVSLVPAARRGRALGLYGTTVWLGLSVGPQLGASVLEARGFAACWLLCVLLELAAISCVVVVRGGRTSRSAEAAAPAPRGRPDLVRTLVPPGARRPGAAIALAACGEGVVTAFLVLHLVGRGVPDGAGLGSAASVYSVFAVTVLVLRVVLARSLDGGSPERLAAAALLAEAAGLALLAGASSFAAGAAGAILMGAGFAVLYPTLALLATRASPASEHGAALGAFGSSFSLGLVVGPLVGGLATDVVGTGAPFALAGVAAAGASFAIIRPRSAGSSASVAARSEVDSA